MAELYLGSDLKILIDIKGTGFNQATDNYTIDLYTGGERLTYTQADVINNGGKYYLPVPYSSLKAGTLSMVVTAMIPDNDFQGGVRREVAKPINIGNVKVVLK